MERPAPTYKIKRREIVAETEGLRVSVLTLDRGEKVPWHHHSAITDTFICMQGPLRIETRDPHGVHVLEPGQRYAAPPKQAHEVSGLDGGPCQFLIVQGVGTYDFVPRDGD